MTDVHKALLTFFSGFGCKAYLSGHVPRSAVFPYFTFDPADGNAFTSTILTAFVWCKSNAQRVELLDKVAAAIPAQGTTLPMDGGLLAIYRNDASFLSNYDDPTDASILGGRISYEVRFLHA